MAALQGVLDFEQLGAGEDGRSEAWAELSTGTLRTDLDYGAWVEIRPGWLRTPQADDLFTVLRDDVAWKAERRQMYDVLVDVPRLTRFYDEDEAWPHPLLAEARDRLSGHYLADADDPFRTVGLCRYRDGSDSVAWHGDRIGRSRYADTHVAILSLGATRVLALRPAGGGPSRRFLAGHGDLLVMGGSCQRTWDHCIPKTREPVGERISVQFRPRGVR